MSRRLARSYRYGPCTLEVEHGTNRCLYRYRCVFHDPDVGFSCSMLSEVGEKYQPFYRGLIYQHGLVIETRSFETKPWFGDVLVGAEEPCVLPK